MTIDEQQHLLILEKLLDTKGKKLYDHEYSNLVKDITGNSHNFIKKNLLANGYLEDSYNSIDEETPDTWPIDQRTCYKIFLTDIGIKAYHTLKIKKRKELYQTIAFWFTLIFAFVSALYGVLTYYDHPKSQSSPAQQSPALLMPTDTTILKENKLKSGAPFP